MKIASNLKKQLYIYNRVKFIHTKTCKMLISKLYKRSEIVWKYVTRPLIFGILAGVKKLSVIAHKTFGIGCHTKITTHIAPAHFCSFFGSINSKFKQCTVHIFMKVYCEKVENMLPVHHLGFLSALVYLLRLYRLYDRFSSRQILPVFYMIPQCNIRTMNNRDNPSRINIIEHLKSHAKMDERKTKPEFFEKSIKNIIQKWLSHKIDEHYYSRNFKGPIQAKNPAKTGNILLKMKCDSMTRKKCRDKSKPIMIISNPYPPVFNKTVYLLKMTRLNIEIFCKSMAYDTKIYFFEND